MAISKMKKVTILSPRINEEPLMKLMQNMQNIEIVSSIKDLTEESRLLKEISSNDSDVSREYDGLEKQLGVIQSCVTYLMPHIAKKEQTIRTEQTMAEFEERVQLDQLEETIGRVKAIHHREIRLDEQLETLRTQATSLEKWQNLTMRPQELGDALYTTTTMGDFSVAVKEPLLSAIRELPAVKAEVIYESQTRVYLLVVNVKKDDHLVSELLNNHSFNWFDYQEEESPRIVYRKTQAQLVKVTEKKRALIAELKSFEQELRFLMQSEEVLLSRMARSDAKKKLGIYNQFIVIRGWIESEGVPLFDQQVGQISTPQQPVVVTYEEAKVSQEVPTALKNNRLVRPFEMITEMYSLPKYGELDPTPLLMPFYMVFFGMMVADVGYGMLMLIVTTVVKRLSLRTSAKNFVELFQFLSLPVMIWGGIYGSFFGLSLPFHLLSTTKDMNTILLISVIFGVIQLFVGLLVNGIQLVKKQEYLKSVSEAFAWQGILISAIMLVTAKLLFANQWLTTVSVGTFILCALCIIFVPMILSPSKGKGLAKGVYAFYGITGYIGDLVSYTRLMALGISGGSIAAAFNMLVGFMPPLARFSIGLILIVLLHGLNIFLSLLSAYVHGARLQYVEYFGKFFQGGGKKFSPLKPEEKYLDFKINDKN